MKGTFSISTTMVDTDNRFGSEYIANNYVALLRFAEEQLTNPAMAGDLLNDVYLGVINDEENGEAFDATKCKHKDDFTVENWVKCRIRMYAKNIKYAGKVATKSGHEVSIGAVNLMDAEESGGGQAGYLQQAYFNAPHIDDVELLEMEVTVREEMEYLYSFEDDSFEFGFKAFMDNLLDIIADRKFDFELLHGIRGIGEDIREAVSSIVTLAVNKPQVYMEHLRAIQAAC